MKSDPEPKVYLEIFERAKRVLGRFEEMRKRMAAFPIKAEVYARVFQHMSRSRLRSIRKMITRLEKKADFCEEVVAELETKFQELLKSDLGAKGKRK